MAKRIRLVSKISKIEAEIDSIIGEVLLKHKNLYSLHETWVPPVDISEREDKLKIEIELPGIDHKDISLLLHSNRIEVRGIKKENLPPHEIRFHRLEREYGSFSRTIFLPDVVMPEKTQAFLVNGVLTVHLRKYSRQRDKKTILPIEKASDRDGG